MHLNTCHIKFIPHSLVYTVQWGREQKKPFLVLTKLTQNSMKSAFIVIFCQTLGSVPINVKFLLRVPYIFYC